MAVSPTPMKGKSGRNAKRKSVKRVFEVIIQKDETGMFVVTVPAVRGAVSQGRTIAEAKRNIVEAIELMLEDSPSGSDSTFVGIERVEVSA